MSFQDTLDTLKQYTFPKRRALERELAAAREENQTVSAELVNVRQEFEDALKRDADKIADLNEKISAVEYDRSAARHKVHVLKTALEEAESRQQHTEVQISALESRLEEERQRYEASQHQVQTVETSLEEAAVRQQHAEQQIGSLESRLEEEQQRYEASRHQVETLETALEEAEVRQKHTEQQLSALETRLEEEHRQHESSRHQVHTLETSLGETSLRLEETEQQIGSLETKIEEERRQHAASLNMTQESLARLLTEQQNLLTLQSDLARTFHEGNTRLVESIQAAGIKPRPSNFQMTAVAALLFLTGTLTGVVMHRSVQDSSTDLAGVTSGIEELQVLMQEHFTTREEILKILREALDRDRASATVPRTENLSSRMVAPLDQEQEVPGKPELATSGIIPQEPEQLIEDALTKELSGDRDYSPAVAELQTDLMSLGFDLGSRIADGIRGARTEQALEAFRELYFPAGSLQESPDTEKLAAAAGRYAELARKDAKRFKIDSAVLAAIRLGSLRTGVDFSFLMELAAIESSFKPAAAARTSSATGLYQFKDESWLDAVKLYGRKYGLGKYARQVEYVVSSKGIRQPVIRDAAVQQQVLDLRYDPKMSALLAAENVKQNMRQLVRSFDREPGRTELYLTHFFGATGAISFLKALEKHPDKIAGEIFPGPARRNKNIFRMQSTKPRTVAEVYEVFDRKFNTARYESGEQG